jgi:hypothetical protein
LIAAGIALRAWSIATLGRFFQYQIQVQRGHRVVTGGPYRYVRHPSYSGIALVLAGIALACDDVWSLVAVAVLGGAGLAVRIRAEERQLAGALDGEQQFHAPQLATRAPVTRHDQRDGPWRRTSWSPKEPRMRGSSRLPGEACGLWS